MNIHQKILEKKLQNILLQLLNGHFDLVQKIIFFKKELEYDIIKNQKIELRLYLKREKKAIYQNLLHKIKKY